MDLRKAGLAAAAVATVGAGVLGGAAIATASDDTGTSARHGSGYAGPGGGPGGPEGRPWAHGGPFSEDAEDPGEAVSGTELTSVTEAVAGFDATLTVDHVVKRDDGTYLVLATGADEARTALSVSADLATVAEAEGPDHGPGGPGGAGGPGGPGGHGGHGPLGEEVTGDELADVTAAVTAYDAALSVEHVVQRDDDGDYFVLATGADDERTALRVSADLASVEELDGPPRGGPAGSEVPPSAPESGGPSASSA